MELSRELSELSEELSRELSELSVELSRESSRESSLELSREARNLSKESVLDIPTPEAYVSDFAGVFAENEEAKLNEVIGSYDRESSVQIALVTVKSLEGMDAGDLAHRLADKWGVGQRENDNGILILLKPKYGGEKGQVFIAVGYGMEHLVPDAIAKRIVESIMIPSFRKGDYYWGIYDGMQAIIGLSEGAYINDFIPFYDRQIFIFGAIVFIALVILFPILYLIYLGRRAVPEEYACYYIKGAYNSENLFNQLDLMERVFGRKYTKFRKYIRKYELVSRKNLMKYSGKIDKNMFCYLLNGRERKKVFWEMSDPVLKIMMLFMAVVIVGISVVLHIMEGWVTGIISSAVGILVYLMLFNFLLSFMELYQFSLRSKAKYVGGVSVSLFALNALFKRSIKKTYNSSTNSWVYAPIITFSSGGGGFSSGGFGGGGFGGFGGGGFGGGGAGGSW